MMLKPRTIERVFVTGATGFIGSALVNHLLQQNLQIRCLVHQSPLLIDSPKVEIVQSNLTDFNWEQLEDYSPNVIYHFARIPGKTKKERKDAAAQNARANEQLMQWMHKQNNPPLLVFGSGTLVYGDHGEKWVDESVQITPISFQREYFEAEKPILKGLEQSGLPIIIVRPPWIYGAGSWFEWFFKKHMQDNKTIPQYGNGQNYMSLIHIDDCAGLIHQIGKYGKPGQIFNITGHPPIRQHQFVEQLQKLRNLPIKKYSSLRLSWQFGKAAREALTFSLKSATKHEKLVESYPYKYPELKSGLHSILKKLDEK